MQLSLIVRPAGSRSERSVLKLSPYPMQGERQTSSLLKLL